jgi:uncharacterized LabA/DUF88 family protein
MSAPKLSIFIDGGYLFKVFDKYRKQGYRQSLKRLTRLLSQEQNLKQIHYVNSINTRNPETKEKQEKFYFGYLKDKLKWETTILPLQWPGGKAEQKGTDTTLALCLYVSAVSGEYDVAILLAADSDFCPSVERVKSLGKIVRNAYFSCRPSFHLQQACNGRPIRLDDLDFIYMDGTPKKLFTLASVATKPSFPKP